MARRPGDEPGFSLSPRARRIGGWVVAALLIGGVAIVVGILGGNGDGTAVLPSPSASASSGPQPEAIVFGTDIDPVTGEVDAASATSAFGPGDAFAYSVRPEAALPTVIYVEVRRVSVDPPEVVQEPSPQELADAAQVIAFVVPADNLLTAFGTGEFEMRIFADPTGTPIAEGRFRLTTPTSLAP